MTTWTVAGLLARTADYLGAKGSTSARLDAELLLAEALGVDRIDLYTQPDRPLTSAELDTYRALVARRARHEPVAYILGRAHFRYLTLEVTPDVLIPRPETEELVEAVLAWLKERPVPMSEEPQAEGGSALRAADRDVGEEIGSGPPVVVDVGTGSGAIALSLATEAGVRVAASDASPDALAVAGRNRRALGMDGSVELRRADLLEGVPDGSLRVVVANPPYIADEDFEGLAPDVRLHEPAAALRAGPGGLDVYRRLVPQAARALGPGGALFLEVGLGQAQAVAGLAEEAGFCSLAVLPDLSGRERMVRAVRPGALRMTLAQATGGGYRLDPVRAAVRAGAVLGLHTDTVYGLAAAWDSARGVRALFEAKGREQERPVQVLFSSAGAIAAALPDLEQAALRVLEHLLPGPYTFVVGTAVPRPPLVGTADSLGVRVPDQPELLRFLAALDIPLAATSANLSGMPDAASVDEVDPAILAACALALVPDAQLGTSAGRASTVVDLRPLALAGEAVVLREGAVAAAAVLDAIDAVRRAP